MFVRNKIVVCDGEGSGKYDPGKIDSLEIDTGQDGMEFLMFVLKTKRKCGFLYIQ